MAVARVRFLSKDEVELVHEQSVRCLEEIGVLVRSHKVLKTLGDAGAHVDMKTGIARIPESLVDEAIRRAPKTIRLCARDPKHDMQLPVESSPHVGTTGLGIYMRDVDTGEKHPSTRKDIADIIKVADALDPVSYVWTTLTATDVDQRIHGLHELWTAFQNSTKHVQSVEVSSAEDSRRQFELAALVAGGEDALRKRPLFSVICCSIAPLSYDEGAVEGMAELAKLGIPVASMSMSLSGGSAPITVAGTVVNANAENLASLAITQFTAPGAPHIYCSSSAPIDMRTGSINYMTAEPAVISASLGQMAERYGLPCEVGDWGLNDKAEPGIPHSFTQVFGVVLTTMSGTDICGGMGGLDAVKGASLEQLVIDAYMWEDVRAYMRKISINEQTAALDVVKAVGHGNTFLAHPHTFRNFKKELHTWDPAKLAMESTLSSIMVPEARRIAKELLNTHQVPPLEREVQKKGDGLLKSFESGLARR
ncbi:MAG TPA: trimethylamine methyltransferase family protein [Thermoplasmata archaeon]|jgi:trimethylamine--corrinoid protein Co-methyltransferase